MSKYLKTERIKTKPIKSWKKWILSDDFHTANTELSTALKQKLKWKSILKSLLNWEADLHLSTAIETPHLKHGGKQPFSTYLEG